MKNEKRNAVLILAACLLWALDIWVRYPITLKMSYVHIVFVESFLGVIFVLPWLIKHGRHELKRFTKTDWALSAFLGGFGMTVAGFLSTASILEATPGMFSFVQIFQPLLVVYAAHLFLKEKIDNLYFYWGLWVVFSAVLMYSQDLEKLLSSSAAFVPGAILIALGTVFIWGFCTIAGKELLKRHRPLTLVSVRWVFAFIFSSFFLLNDKEPLGFELVFEADYLWRFVFISGLAGTISMFLYYSGIRDLAAAKVSFLELCYPAFGILFTAVSTYENVSFLQAMGVASFFAFILLFMGRKDNDGTALTSRPLR